MEDKKTEVQDGTLSRKQYGLILSDIKPLISADLEPLIGDLSDEKKEKIVGLISSRIETNYSSPIPPPAILKGYNEVLDSGAERLMLMAEKQQSHRLDLENKITRAQIKESLRGQLFGLSTAVIGLGLATWLAMTGHETLGGIFGTTTILGLAAVFAKRNGKGEK